MKRFATTFVIVALTTFAALTGTDANAQVSASSYSTGGTAISSAYGRGNTRLNSSAYASGGGYARSTMTGRGVNGGFASGNSRAVSHGGVAISNGNSSANGWGARSHSNSYARTVGGFARSNSNAVANGNWADARSNAVTRTWGTYGSSSSEAIDNRQTGYPVYPTNTPGYTSGNYGGGTSATVYQSSTPRKTIFRSRSVRRGW
ncbi:hypothetical protein Mal15_02040 [Stieleria maiorica]|uniref:Uncharacterized protein n=1 Tax=Stieleria maiorica TaxID=2795974 RepID=A0A5B9MAC2_9BACT|nr:hypothetical protein [Stieleria maiorica]QEF96177.1 hypothetical protein Mal15_02040 [Stieleria maiorica]